MKKIMFNDKYGLTSDAMQAARQERDMHRPEEDNDMFNETDNDVPF